MIFANYDLLFRDPVAFFLLLLSVAAGLIVGITVHEFSHALVSYRLGDSTARRQGRLTLNPLAHLDPMGTILLFLAGFGWGKPTPVNALAFGRNAVQGMALVSLAGPLSNVVVAGIVGQLFRANVGILEPGGWPDLFLSSIFFYNLMLAVFNLLPLAPLDGFKVLLALLPRAWARSFARLEAWGPGILLLIIAIDWLPRFGGASLPRLNILGRILFPPINLLSEVLTGARVIG
ncbi:MAG: site-2 protease family protein [Chloroflexi bacterium]|nr:site-2 protease family protein [Chloroflexota bacterium]